MTIIYITILAEDLLNGVYRTIIYITIHTEDSWNGVHRTIIFITISTEVVLWTLFHETSVGMAMSRRV
jgi:hypothetical protein